jgi:molybdate transport system permease protein
MMRPTRKRMTSPLYFVTTVGLAFALGIFMLIPLLALFTKNSPLGLLRGLGSPIAVPALWLSLSTTMVALAVVALCGTPLAWHLARTRRVRWLETVLQLPMVLPPSVAGIALLMAFGRRGLLGESLDNLGWSPGFSSAAVVMAQVFVSAPFFLQGAIVAFRHLNPSVLAVARSLGASPARLFLQVGLPLARQALLGSALTAWARALGEFGATLMFAGNVGGRTQTLPLAIYTALDTDMQATQSLSVLLVVVAFALLLLVRGHSRVAGTLRPGEGT